MAHVKSNRDAYYFPTAAAAREAAAWWNERFENAKARARIEKMGTAGYLTVIEVQDRRMDGWIIADYLPTDRELWGQMLLPLDRAA